MSKFLLVMVLIFISFNTYAAAEDDVVIKDFSIQANPNFNPYEAIDNHNPQYFMDGRIYNYSDKTVVSYNVRLVFSDCDKKKRCVTVADDSYRFEENPTNPRLVQNIKSIPPRQARDFRRPVINVPVNRGSLSYSVYVDRVGFYEDSEFYKLLIKKRNEYKNSGL